MAFYGSFLHLILHHAPGFQISVLFPHFSDPCCPIVGQWVGSYARSTADLMQSLEKSGVLIKNHRVNKSLDPEEFSDLPLRVAHIPSRSWEFSCSPAARVSPRPRATLLRDGLPTSPKAGDCYSGPSIQLCIFKSLRTG